MSHALCEAGAHVIPNGRDAAKLDDLAGALRDEGFSAETASFDIADFPTSVREFFARAAARLDILVNNAIAMTPAPFSTLTPDAFDQTYRSAVTAAFESTRAALPALKAAVAASDDASIVNISSMYGQRSASTSRIYSKPEQASPLHYGPAKAALLQLTRHLAAELGSERIRVNALVPGPFPRATVVQSDPAFAERLAAKTMLHRTGLPAELAGPLLFLASPAASYVTGAALAVDGGWTAW